MMFSDATLQAHRDAQRFIQEEEMEVNGTTLSKHLYDLLLKNVSKDDPLTQDELQVLRDFRAELSPEQWKGWLKFARAERKKLNLTPMQSPQKAAEPLMERPGIAEVPLPRRRSIREEIQPVETVEMQEPIPREELKELIRRVSLKKVDEEPPSSIGQESIPSIPTEELKSIIRRESLKLLQQGDPNARRSSVNINDRMAITDPPARNENEAAVRRSSVTNKIVPPDHPARNEEEDFKAMAALADKFQANHIRKKSIMHPSTNNNFNIADRVVPDESMIQYHPNSYVPQPPPSAFEEIPSEIQEQQEEEQEMSQPAEPIAPPTFNSFQQQEQPRQQFQQPIQRPSVLSNFFPQFPVSEQFEEEKYEEKRLMNPIYTPYNKAVPSSSQLVNNLTNEKNTSNNLHYNSYSDEENAYNKKPTNVNDDNFLPTADERRFSKYLASSRPFQEEYSAIPTPQQQSQQILDDSVRKPRAYPQLDAGVSLEKKSLARGPGGGSGSNNAHPPSPMLFNSQAGPSESYAARVSAILAEEQQRVRNLDTPASLNTRAHQMESKIPVPSSTAFDRNALPPPIQKSRSHSPVQANHHKSPPSQSQSGYSSHRSSPLLPQEYNFARDHHQPVEDDMEEEEERKGYYYDEQPETVRGKEATEEDEDFIILSKADLELLKEQLLLQLTMEEKEKKEKLSKIQQNFFQNKKKEENKILQEQLNETMINADNSTKRLTSVTSAAKYLIKSLDHFQETGNLHPYESDGLEASKLILSEVVECLDKSKQNSQDIAEGIQERQGTNKEKERARPSQQQYKREQNSNNNSQRPSRQPTPVIVQEEPIEDDIEDDNYSELDEKHPSYDEPPVLPVFQKPLNKQPVHAIQEKLQQQKVSAPSAPSAPVSNKPKESVLQSLFKPYEDPASKNSIQNNRPFAGSSSIDYEDVTPSPYLPDGEESKYEPYENASQSSLTGANFPKENHFNTVFNQSLQQRDYQIDREQKQQESFMKDDELNTSVAIGGSANNNNKPPKRSRRDSKYNHDVNNYWNSFDANDIIHRIHSIDRSLANHDLSAVASNPNAAHSILKENMKKEIVPRRQSLLSSNNFDPSTQSYSMNNNAVTNNDAGSNYFGAPSNDSFNAPPHPPQSNSNYPFTSSFNQPSSPLDQPSSNYAPKPFETNSSSSPFHASYLNNSQQQLLQGPASPAPLYPNHIENPHSSLHQAIKQETAFNAITNRFQDSLNQRQYQYLFDKHRMESSGTVTRLCLVEGPLVKAFEEYPIRIDLEACSIDVVWREPKQNHNLTMQLKKSGGKLRKPSSTEILEDSQEFLKRSLTSPLGKDIPPLPSTIQKRKQLETYYHDLMTSIQQQNYQSRILRRERFLFDFIYTGNQCFIRLKDYLKYRIRYSLTNYIHQVILCTSCAEINDNDLEPPVTLSLGNGGGTGICSTILKEIFLFLSKKTKPNQSHGSSMNQKNNIPFSSINQRKGNYPPSYISTQIIQEHEENRITMSIVLVKGQLMMDLLNNNPMSTNKPKILQNKKTGRVTLLNATQVDLLNVLDFERIVGLLLGRRTGIYEALKNMEKSVIAKLPFQIPKTLKEKKESHFLNSYATWNPNHATSRPTASSRGNNHNNNTRQPYDDVEINFHPPADEDNEEEGGEYLGGGGMDGSQLNDIEDDVIDSEKESILQEHTPSLLITFNVSYGSILAKKRNNVTFRVLCPCGDTWYQPGYDLNIFAETVAALPHLPPQNILTVSPLTSLLTDPTQMPIHYLSVANVIRKEQPPMAANTYSAGGHHRTGTSVNNTTAIESMEQANDLAMNSLPSLRIASIPK